jgi:RNA polymerase sigma-70 factor (ECF subfamily)
MRSDTELAAAFRDGEDGAFSVLYDRYKQAVLVFGTKMLGDGDSARDLVQEVFLRVFQSRSRMQRPERFRAWIFTIARNHCISQIRKDRAPSSLESAPEEAMAVEPGPSGIESEEDARMVRTAMASVKDEYREVLILREYEDLSYREIAEITETTEDAVKARIGKDGSVLEAKVGGGESASPALEKAALDAVRGWTFTPARAKGQPVETWVVLPVKFKLK